MSLHVMLDLECLGTTVDSAILSIGAVKFDPMSDEKPEDAIYIPVDPKDCQRLGMRVDADTVMWWLNDERDPARKELLRLYKEQKPLELTTALSAFSDWYGVEPLPVWGYPVTFDNAIMNTAYARCGDNLPWDYLNDSRCLETLISLAPSVERPLFFADLIPHHPVDDCVSQIAHLRAIVKHLGLRI